MTMTNPPEHKLRWYQYKLSSLFILTTLVAFACSWYANEMQKAAKRRAGIAELIRLRPRFGVKTKAATGRRTPRIIAALRPRWAGA